MHLIIMGTYSVYVNINTCNARSIEWITNPKENHLDDAYIIPKGTEASE